MKEHKHLCVRCGMELSNTTQSMGDPFGAFSPTIRYCANSFCEYCGILTYGEKPQKSLRKVKGEVK